MRNKIMLSVLIAGIVLGTLASTSVFGAEVKFSLYMYSTDYKPVWKNIVDDFEKTHPGIDVKMETLDLGVIKDKIVIEWRAGVGPDVVLSVPEDTIDMAALGFIQDLSPWVSKWDEADRFFPWAWKGATLEGEFPTGYVHGVPIDATMRAFMYREDLYKKYGADVPKYWSELKVTASKISAQEKGVSGFGFCSAQNVRTPQEFNVLLWQLGVDIVKEVNGKWKIGFDVQDAARVLRGWWYDMVHVYDIVPMEDLGWGWQELDQSYVQGVVAGSQNGPWMKFYVKNYPDAMKATNFTAVPTPAGGNPATFLEVECAVMNKNSKDKEAAWEFIKHIGGADSIRQLAEVVKIAPRQDVTNLPQFAQDKWSKPWIEMAAYGHVQPPIPLARYNTAVNTAIGNVCYDVETPEEAAEGIIKALQGILDTIQ